MAATPPRRPPTTAASTSPCWRTVRARAAAPTSACAPRSAISARPSPKTSEPGSSRGKAFCHKSYEKTSHGGQLEDVQDARGNHCLLREVSAAGRAVDSLRDRDLPSVHESC